MTERTDSAVSAAETADFEGVPFRVVGADYLAVIALSVGRAENMARVSGEDARARAPPAADVPADAETEALDPIGVGGHAGWQDLESHLAPKLCVGRTVHLTCRRRRGRR